MTHTRDPQIELTQALYGTLRSRWKSWQDAIRTGPQSLVDTTRAALDLTLVQCATALDENADPPPAIIFLLEYQ
jgi:hypothetical protein